MTVIELPQGHPSYVGWTREQLLNYLHHRDIDSQAAHPDWYHQPSWREREIPDHEVAMARAPFGCEWYAVGDDGRLFLHSADYDSSG